MAGLVSATILEQVRAANDIVDVIGAVVPLKRAGTNFVALCPFHKEKTPSFNVSPQRQIFHCFGCHKGGDVFRFIQDYESLSFIEAVRRLAERAKIPLEVDQDRGGEQGRYFKDALLNLHEQVTQRWHTALVQDAAGEGARAYLSRRGVSAEAIELFRLGFAPDAWDDTVNWAVSKGYELSLVEQAGLILRKDPNSRPYDRFRGRLIFPIGDEQGRVIAFSGRILTGDEKAAKYVNSPETPIFTKGKVFYGLDKSKRALLEAQTAVICEGQLDLIACFTAGVRHVVAPQGTAFTADHGRILKRYVNEVVLCFDSDAAGQNAAVRVLDSLLASGLAIRVATMPAPHDPDSFIKQFGGEAFAALIGRAEGFFDYYLERLCANQDINSDKGQLAVSRAMAEAVQKTESPVLLDRYAQKTALRLGVSPDAMRLDFKKFVAAGPRTARVSAEAGRPEPIAPPSPLEFWLVKIILLHEELIGTCAKHIQLSWLQHPSVRDLIKLRLDAHLNQTWTSTAALLTHIEEGALRAFVSQILAEERPVLNPEQQLSDILIKMRNQSLDREIAALDREAGNPQMGAQERANVLRRSLEMRAAKKQPLPG